MIYCYVFYINFKLTTFILIGFSAYSVITTILFLKLKEQTKRDRARRKKSSNFLKRTTIISIKIRWIMLTFIQFKVLNAVSLTLLSIIKPFDLSFLFHRSVLFPLAFFVPLVFFTGANSPM